jgi:hypothetical protein
LTGPGGADLWETCAIQVSKRHAKEKTTKTPNSVVSLLSMRRRLRYKRKYRYLSWRCLLNHFFPQAQPAMASNRRRARTDHLATQASAVNLDLGKVKAVAEK